MKYFLPCILWFTALPAMAGVCDTIKDDFQRLSCFDHVGKCLAIDESRQRLACFDSNYDTWAQSNTESVSMPASTNAEPLAAADSAATTNPEPDVAVEQGGATTIIPDVTAKLPAADEKAKRDNLAFPLAKSQSGSVEKPVIAATIMDITTDGFRVDYLTLDNDQVWRESSNSKFIFKIGQKIRIRKGFLGSNVLIVEGSRAMIKVKRIR